MKFMYITNIAMFANEQEYLYFLEKAVDSGVWAVQFREQDLPLHKKKELLKRIKSILAGSATKLIVNTEYKLVEELELEGIHLNKKMADYEEIWERYKHKYLLGFSTHSLAEAREFLTKGYDYVLLSPIFFVPDKNKPLGPNILKALTPEEKVFALGGINNDNIDILKDETAVYGIAFSRAVKDEKFMKKVKKWS